MRVVRGQRQMAAAVLWTDRFLRGQLVNRAMLRGDACHCTRLPKTDHHRYRPLSQPSGRRLTALQTLRWNPVPLNPSEEIAQDQTLSSVSASRTPRSKAHLTITRPPRGGDSMPNNNNLAVLTDSGRSEVTNNTRNCRLQIGPPPPAQLGQQQWRRMGTKADSVVSL